jgi:hypothetical protein
VCPSIPPLVFRLAPTTSSKSKTVAHRQLCMANLASNTEGINQMQFAFEDRGDAKMCFLSHRCISSEPEPSGSACPPLSPLHRGSVLRPMPLPRASRSARCCCYLGVCDELSPPTSLSASPSTLSSAIVATLGKEECVGAA